MRSSGGDVQFLGFFEKALCVRSFKYAKQEG